MGGYLESNYKGDLVKYSDHLEAVLELNVQINNLKKKLTKNSKILKSIIK